MALSVFSDEYFMGEALKEAQKAFDADEVPIGAVIVSNNIIIARAHNLIQRLKDATAHAEMLAFTSASEYLKGKYLKGCSLYVTLEPCVMCAGASHWVQIEKIVIGAMDLKRGYTNYSNQILHPKTQVVTGIREVECAGLLIEYFKTKR